MPKEVEKLREEIRLLRGGNAAQEERDREAAFIAGIPYGGCDTSQDLADLVQQLGKEMIDVQEGCKDRLTDREKMYADFARTALKTLMLADATKAFDVADQMMAEFGKRHDMPIKEK